ncbi:rRNA maturation RNase YbeY [bacterium]|nr:rRNA maturation RNase YbeY [bacterium]
MAFSIISKQKTVELDRKTIRTLVKALLAEHNALDADLTLTFAGDAYVHELNRDYRGIDRPTDVLSFVMRDGVDRRDDDEELVLGDVIISVDRAAVQARRFKRTVEREILKLVAHGVLHLLGHDHEDDAKMREMRRIENRHVRAVLKR